MIQHMMIESLARAVKDLRDALKEQLAVAERAIGQLDKGYKPMNLGYPVDLEGKAERVHEMARMALSVGVSSKHIDEIVKGVNWFEITRFYGDES